MVLDSEFSNLIKVKHFTYQSLNIAKGLNSIDISDWEIPNGYIIYSINVDSAAKVGIHVCEVDQGSTIIIESYTPTNTYFVFRCLLVNTIFVN